MKTKAIRYFQTDRTLTRIVSPPLESGSEDEVDDENSWLGAGGDLNELRINVKTNNTTGAERKLDVVIMDSNWDAELFRIPIVQKAN